MFDTSSRWHRLRGVLVASILGPLLVLGAPSQAAPVYAAAGALDAVTVAVGPTVTGTVHTQESGIIPDDDVDCTYTGYLRLNDAGIYSVRNKMRCNFGSNFDHSEAVALRAYGGDGQACSFSGYYQPEDDVDLDTTLVPFNLHSSEPFDPDCNITRGEVVFWDVGDSCTAGVDNAWYYDFSTDQLCPMEPVFFAWELGSLPEAAPEGPAPAGCANGNLTAVAKAKWEYLPFPLTRLDGTSTGTPGGKLNYKLTATIPWVWTSGSPNITNDTSVTFQHYWRTPSGTEGAVGMSNSTTPSTVNTANTFRYPNTPIDPIIWWDGPSTTDKPAGYELIGFRVYLSGSGVSPGCSWYWGKTITGRAETNAPLGPIKGYGPGSVTETDPTNPAPDANDDDEGECSGFSLTDPSSWAGAGVCTMVKGLMGLLDAIGRLLQAVADLPGKIADLIGDLLAALFVPSDGYIDGKVDEVKDAWSNTAPLTFLDGVTDVGNALTFPQPAGGCAGPDLSFTAPVAEQTVHLSPLSTCRAEVEQIADLTKTVLTIVVYVGAILAAARIIAAAFGVTLTFGGKDAEA